MNRLNCSCGFHALKVEFSDGRSGMFSMKLLRKTVAVN